MGAVARVAGQRLAGRWRPVMVAGVLLGLGFGLSLASFAAARRTASAYDRVLAAADAEDATVAHGRSPSEAAEVLDGIDGIIEHRYQAGFVGFIDGVDPALTGGLLASADDEFATESPTLRAGRLPDPDRAEEVFVNASLADKARLELGQRLDLHLLKPDGSGLASVHATIVGIGTLPREAVIDETEYFGIIAFTRAFHEAHADLRVYSSSGLYLAPGVDARRDLAPSLAAVGFEMSESRSQDRQGVSDALRPLVTLLVCLGLLAFVATAVAASQIVQRDQERWRADDQAMSVLGMVRWQVLLVGIATSGVIAGAAVMVALCVLVAASPVAPLGPLHALDPTQGLMIDLSVAVAGTGVVVATIAMLTAGFALMGRGRERPASTIVSPLATVARRPAAVAGLTLGLGVSGGRRRALRSVGFATATVVLTAAVATLVVSSVTLSADPSRYGVDWDLMAVNPFGDQTPEALQAAFGGEDVTAATSFNAWTFLVNGRAVPGLGATVVKGELGPTLLDGDPVRSDDEIVLGQDVVESLGVEVGDTVAVQVAGRDEGRVGRAVPLRVVGIATFPSVVQPGTDSARLGNGVLVTRDAYFRMAGVESEEQDHPEWTAVRLADGVDPAAVIAHNPEGIEDARGIPTSWYTDAKPAELRQIDSVRTLLVGAIAVTYFIMLAVVGHALWSQARANRRDLAVLGTIGFTRRQLREVAGWQATPFALASLLIGIPLGVAIGRRSFSLFAHSLAVVDDAASPVSLVGALVLAVLVATALGMLAAMSVPRRARAAAMLRAG